MNYYYNLPLELQTYIETFLIIKPKDNELLNNEETIEQLYNLYKNEYDYLIKKKESNPPRYYYHDDIVFRSKLDDTELYNIYKTYCEKNNLRRDINRAVRKFREFCKLRLDN